MREALARSMSEIINTIDSFDFSAVECIHPNILTPGFHDLVVDIRNLSSADLFTINCVYMNEIKMFASQLNAMMRLNMANKLVEEIGLFQGLKSAVDEKRSQITFTYLI